MVLFTVARSEVAGSTPLSFCSLCLRCYDGVERDQRFRHGHFRFSDMYPMITGGNVLLAAYDTRYTIFAFNMTPGSMTLYLSLPPS
jgi:hypothetical protein